MSRSETLFANAQKRSAENYRNVIDQASIS